MAIAKNLISDTYKNYWPRLKSSRTYAVLAALLITPIAIWALNPKAPPGSNFDLSHWELTLPTGSKDNPNTVSNTSLEHGYTSEYFYTGSSGEMVFYDPGSNCVTTPGSEHCRTEFHEIDPSNWSGSGTNTLTATVSVQHAGASDAGGVVVGQIFPNNSKPMLELYYRPNGDIVAGQQQDTSGSLPEVVTTVGHANLNEQFTYVLSYSDDKLEVTINGTTTRLSTYSLGGLTYYFKAGCYGQSTSSSQDSFYELTIHH